MTSPKPTVLFIHGAWHQPLHYGPIRKIFEAAGYPTSCPLQPTFNQAPPIGLMEDAQCISDELKRLVNDEGKDVIVVGHSYGGVVATQAVDETFAKKKREAEGKQGGVLGLLFMCAFLLPLNVSLVEAFGGSLPPFLKFKDDGTCTVPTAAQIFYNDLSEQDQQHWISELGTCPRTTQFTPITYTAYLHHPVTYLYCTNDQGLPYEIQQMMVNNVSEATGIKFATETCDSSHSPYLSMPERVLQVVEHIAA